MLRFVDWYCDTASAFLAEQEHAACPVPVPAGAVETFAWGAYPSRPRGRRSCVRAEDDGRCRDRPCARAQCSIALIMGEGCR